jgi:murein DD-endopeptidase MepM/ murein hydrolase activator NlpD
VIQKKVFMIGMTIAVFAASAACTRPVMSNQPGPPTQSSWLSTQLAYQPESSPTIASPFDPNETPSATPDEPEPVVSPTFPATATYESSQSGELIVYEAQSGDTLYAVAVRFSVHPSDITSDEPLPPDQMLIDPGQLLFIPDRLNIVGPSVRLIPDSELVFSPHASAFDVEEFVREQGGYLNQYTEYIGTDTLSGIEIVNRVAMNHSINPRILLAVLEYYTGWVTDPATPSGSVYEYPLGYRGATAVGLYRQLLWLAGELGRGYYDWRAGRLTDVHFSDGSIVRLAPDLNAGTVAVQYFLGLSRTRSQWDQALSVDGLIATYRHMFGDPWSYDYLLFEPGVTQPELELPFLPGHIWAFTGGPHGAWERDSAWAALDFAPGTEESGCNPSEDWVTASAPGIVVRSAEGVVVVDLDGDGREQTGWALMYLHVAEQGRIEVGTYVETGDLLGHPSCEGGAATGTHIHLARKYNGEWILADGPIPFVLSGWEAQAGTSAYQGALVKGDQTIIACPCASSSTYIKR